MTRLSTAYRIGTQSERECLFNLLNDLQFSIGMIIVNSYVDTSIDVAARVKQVYLDYIGYIIKLVEKIEQNHYERTKRDYIL